MWKARPEEKPVAAKPSAPPLQTTLGAPTPNPVKESRLMEPPRVELFATEITARIGKLVSIKGEVSGTEDIYVDGEVSGTIEVHGQKVVVGPNGRIRANIRAREAVLHGRVDGNINVSERVELKSTCTLAGDINANRIVIEEGAVLKGSVDMGRDGKADKAESARPSVAAAHVEALSQAEPQHSVLERSPSIS
jgi:cytoskeletal protein CcmA (bactofilin family)